MGGRLVSRKELQRLQGILDSFATTAAQDDAILQGEPPQPLQAIVCLPFLMLSSPLKAQSVSMFVPSAHDSIYDGVGLDEQQ